VLPANDSSTTGNTVLLCVTQYRLSVLTPGGTDDAFNVSKGYSMNSIVCWKLHYSDRQNNRVADLAITVATDENPSPCTYYMLLKF